MKTALQIQDLLRFARQQIQVRPPGIEDPKKTEWALEVSKILPEFDHWDGQPLANRAEVEATWPQDSTGAYLYDGRQFLSSSSTASNE